MSKKSRKPRRNKKTKAFKGASNNRSRDTSDAYIFIDQQAGRRFKDESSSGEPIPSNYLIDPNTRDYLNEISGRDRIIEYAFGEINGPFKVGSGLFDGDDIVAAPANTQEREYLKNQLSFLGSALSLTFNEVEFESADLRFFANLKDHPSSEAAVAWGETVDVHWERLAKGREMDGNTRLTLSHELAHALGLHHVDALSGLSEKDVFKKWGVSDSVMIAWEKPTEYYNRSFTSDHQWLGSNDLGALKEIWLV